MESPVVIDKPPEYHGNGSDGRGFPFDEEEGSGAWSELAARHPDIAARLRQRPSTWTSKRRPTSQDADDFSDSFRGFDRFPFDEIPPEFRGHFPSHWNRRFGSRDETPPQQPAAAPQSPQPPQQTTAATQTELAPETPEQDPQTTLPQYGLRNTVDLGQKSPADPSLIDAQERGQRSMSAPPDNRSPTPNPNITSRKMSSQNHKDQGQEHPSNVRHIPIFVEGRDEPVINKTVDHGTHFADTKPAYASPPQQPHIDRDQYFADEGPTNFHHTPNFSRAFGTPFNKGFRQNSQPFVQQKVYPQNAFARGASPQRSQSPKQQMHPEEHFAKVPVQHEHAAPPSRPQQKQQQKPAPQQQHPPPPQQHQQQPPPGQHQHQTPPQHPPPREETPPPKPQQTSSNDPITQILSIQTDVLNLMTDVENFTGTKKDKRYLFLDEMLTRNLIKLDNIETDGKENIRQARKEAIRCIQKCIAVLEAKAEKGNSTPQPQDVEMVENSESQQQPAEQTESKENGEVEMKEADKENGEIDMTNVAKEEKKEEQTVVEEKETAEPQAADTRPVDAPVDVKIDDTANADKSEQNNDTEKKSNSKKIVKKRDKSKEPSNKEEATMQVDAKADKEQMDVDASASQ